MRMEHHETRLTTKKVASRSIMNERKKQRGWQAERRPDRTDDPVGRAESVSKTGDWERIDGRASAVERGDWGGSGRNNRPALPVRWLLAAAVLLCTVLAVAGCAGQSGSGYVDAVVEDRKSVV